MHKNAKISAYRHCKRRTACGSDLQKKTPPHWEGGGSEAGGSEAGGSEAGGSEAGGSEAASRRGNLSDAPALSPYRYGSAARLEGAEFLRRF